MFLLQMGFLDRTRSGRVAEPQLGLGLKDQLAAAQLHFHPELLRDQFQFRDLDSIDRDILLSLAQVLQPAATIRGDEAGSS